MPNFIFEKIDIPGGPGTNGFVYISVNGVDSSGLAVGNFGDTDGDWHGFTVTHNGPFTQYDPPNSSNNTEVVGIADSGEIYGDYTDWSNVQHGFVASGGVTTTIDVPFATATNISGATASGELFGSYVYGGEIVEGFLDNNGTFTTIVDPAGQSTGVSGVNASGVIVGAITDSEFVVHAFVDNGGTFTTLNPPGSYSSSAVGVTSSGEVVGTYQDTANDQYGFIYNNGTYTKIAVAGSTDNVISQVTDSGEIVGYYVDASGNIDGFIDQNGTIATVDVPGATDTEIMGVNTAGEIYGDYNDSLGQHGFVGFPDPVNISVNPTAAVAVQGGPAIAVLSGAPDISDTSSTTLSSATIAIANASGNPVTGDELYIDGQQSGTVDGGLVTVSWNDTTKTLTLTGTASIADYQTLLGEVTYQDNGTDISTGSHPQHAVTWTVTDGTFSNNTTSEVTIDRAPVTTVANVTLNPNGITVAASTLVTASDPDGDPVTTYAFQDTSNGHFILNGVVEPNNQEIDVTAAQLSQLTYEGAGGTDTVQARTSDGTSWGSWQNFTITGPTATAIQTDGPTELAQIGNSYYLDNTGTGIGPELHYGGSVATAGEFGTYVPIGAVQVAGGDYDVAWHDPSSGLYSVWSVDSNGNYLSNLLSPVAGNSTALENFETIFNQDLNGDGSIGPPPPTTLSIDGTTTLVQSGTNYFLDVTGSSILGPELQRGGSVVTAGEFGTYVPIGAVQVAGGDYDVAWHDPSSGLYTVWSTDSNGNYLSNLIGAVAGNSTALENFETIFNQDLNGDGSIGPPPPTTLSVDGTTTLVQSGTNYFLDVTGSNILGPELHYGGSVVTAGEFGTYQPIDAVQVAGGDYDIAWHDPSSGLYSVWSVDSNGNYLSNLLSPVAGNSTALENFETTFNHDLNGDGSIGPPPPPPPTTLSIDGTTTLVQSGTHYFLDATGSNTLGPELQRGGSVVTAGEFGTYVPIGAVQVAGGGYDIAWHDPSSGLYTVWSVDSNGNYLSNLIGAVAGNSTALENFETVFNQDLNGDGTVGIYVAPGTTLQVTSSLPSAVGAATIGAAATLELAISDSASITFNSSTGMLKLDSLTAFTGAIDNFTGNGSLSGSDQIDLKGINFNSVHDSYSNGVLTVTDGTDTTTLDFNGTYSLANFKFASDSSGGTIVYDPPATAQPQSPTTAAHTANNPSHDSFVFAPILNHNSATDSHPAMDAGQFSPAASWNAATFLSETRDGPHGHAFMANSAHDAMPEQPLTAAQFYVHHGDFHFV